MNTTTLNSELDNIPATRRLVEQLYAHGKITSEARAYALELIYPERLWGLWASRLLLAVGITLMLAGVIYLFAFNWARITPAVKLFGIQAGMVACLLGAYYYSLANLSGRVLLLCASVLVGVFIAVFGQIYQTGADSYQLFATWSILIIGWTLIANFAPQWLVWLTITNLALMLWWRQVALPSKPMEDMIYTYMIALNGMALILREYLAVKKNCDWLAARWTRMALLLATLTAMLMPIVLLLVWPFDATESMLLGSAIGLIGHAAIFYLYRYRLKDMWALTTTVFSICIIAELFLVRFFWPESASSFLIVGLLTLVIFTAAIKYLRGAAKKPGAGHA